MANTILNISNGRYVKQSQADRWYEQGCIDWIDERTIRNLDRQERLERYAAIREHSRIMPEVLPPKEIHGIVERMPKSEVFTPAIRYELLGQARELCEAR